MIVREYNNTVHGVTSRTPLDYIRAWNQRAVYPSGVKSKVVHSSSLNQKSSHVPTRVSSAPSRSAMAC